EHWRSHWPHTAGTIVWQLNDLWPVTSWAAIDGAGRRKPLYFEMRSLYAARALTIQPRDGGLVVAVLNDEPAAWAGPLLIERLSTDGLVISSAVIRVDVPARSVTEVRVPAPVAEFEDPASQLLVARLDGVRNLWFAVPDKDFAYEDAGLTVTVEPVSGGLDVRVQAVGLARDVLLQADRVHPQAVVDRGFVTLLPGESTVFKVRAPIDLDAGLIKAPWALTDLASTLRSGE
ncbi:MAG: glycoside hydrolase family 2 protein, partial [Actinoplanes sp.]